MFYFIEKIKYYFHYLIILLKLSTEKKPNVLSWEKSKTIPKYIGLVGRARVGKDTSGANISSSILKQYNIKYTLCAMAERLKAGCNTFMSEELVKDEYYEDLETTAGKMYQVVGESLRTGLHPKFWINMLKRYIKKNKLKYCIVTDIRLINEAQWITDNGGVLIRIENQNISTTGTMKDGRDTKHISETESDLIKTDLIIHNDTTLEHLYYECEILCDDIVEK